jgi:hypothetical protein
LPNFLRPHGIDRAVAPVLAEAIESAVTAGARPETESEPVALDEGPEDEPPAPAADAGDGVIVPLTHKKYGYALRVHTSPRSHPDAYRLDNGTVKWLRRDVGIGDVVYDIDCGDGAYAMLAAKGTRRTSCRSIRPYPVTAFPSRNIFGSAMCIRSSV